MLGAHVAGVNPKLDTAIARRDDILSFLKQTPKAKCAREETLRQMTMLASQL